MKAIRGILFIITLPLILLFTLVRVAWLMSGNVIEILGE